MHEHLNVDELLPGVRDFAEVVRGESGSGCIDLRCTSARAFLDVLRPSARWWERYEKGHSLLFRGQANSRWQLLPTLWRRDPSPLLESAIARMRPQVQCALEDIRRRLGHPVPSPCAVAPITLFVVENVLALRLAETGDQLGFVMPPCSTPPEVIRARSDIMVLLERVLDHLGIDDQAPTELLAIAQHHGLPTHLLDFTTHPLFAAFFAVERVEGEGAGDIVVWAIAEHVVRNGGRLRIVRPRRTHSAYMLAQEGLFIYDDKGWERAVRGNDFWDYDTVMNEYFSNLTDPFRLKCRVLLSRVHAKQVRELLRRERVTAATVRPSLDNIAQAIRDGDW